MELLLTIVTCFYCCAVLLVFWVLIKKQNLKPLQEGPFISVIIAARNEERRIKPLLESLTEVKYPHNRYEVIFVDDASQDNTAEVIKFYIKNNANWSLIKIDNKDDILRGKKTALKKAIEKSQGEIILTTDADCIVPKEWLSEMVSVFDDKTSMVLGHSLLIKQRGWLNKLLRFDNLFSGIMMAAPTLLGFPITSVGRNMAYRKKSYLKAGGYKKLSSHKSGDDVHLTELFRQKVAGKIEFSLGKNSFTSSLPPDSLKEIFHQQVRKNSKILKKSFPSVALSLFLFLYHVLLVVFPFHYVSHINVWLIILTIKLLTEFITLTAAAKKLLDISIIPMIPFMQIFYPFYVAILGIVGMLQKYEWKK